MDHETEREIPSRTTLTSITSLNLVLGPFHHSSVDRQSGVGDASPVVEIGTRRGRVEHVAGLLPDDGQLGSWSNALLSFLFADNLSRIVVSPPTCCAGYNAPR